MRQQLNQNKSCQEYLLLRVRRGIINNRRLIVVQNYDTGISEHIETLLEVVY